MYTCACERVREHARVYVYMCVRARARVGVYLKYCETRLEKVAETLRGIVGEKRHPHYHIHCNYDCFPPPPKKCHLTRMYSNESCYTYMN